MPSSAHSSMTHLAGRSFRPGRFAPTPKTIVERYVDSSKNPSRHLAACLRQPSRGVAGHLGQLPVSESKDLSSDEGGGTHPVALLAKLSDQCLERSHRVLVDAGSRFERGAIWSVQGEPCMVDLGLHAPTHPTAQRIQEVGDGIRAALPTPLDDELEGRRDEISQEHCWLLAHALAPPQATSNRDDAREDGLEQCTSDERIGGRALKQGGGELGSLELAERTFGFEEGDDVSEIHHAELEEAPPFVMSDDVEGRVA